MAIFWRDVPPTCIVYTWINPQTGGNLNIAAGLLVEACKTLPDRAIVMTNVERKNAEQLMAQGSIEQPRLRAIPADWRRWSPVLYCLDDDGMHFLVDGAHRYYKAAMLGHKLIKSWVLPRDAWAPFIIEGLPNVSQDELAAQPSWVKPGGDGIVIPAGTDARVVEAILRGTWDIEGKEGE